MLPFTKNDPFIKSMIGNFKDDKEYLKAVKTLISCTQETDNRISFIKSRIISSVKKDNVLDIGVGNGELSHILCEYFKNIHLVDPSKKALNSINTHFFKDKYIKKIESHLENFIPLKNYYNLILISHVLYYIKRNLWKSIIQKAFNALKEGGYLLIVLNNGLGRTKLSQDFGAKDVLKIEQLIEECTTIERSSLEIYTTHEAFQPISLEDALEVIGVCLYDVNTQAERTSLIKHLEQNYKKKDSVGYFIDFLQYFFILKRI